MIPTISYSKIEARIAPTLLHLGRKPIAVLLFIRLFFDAAGLRDRER
jgi:hypothetical protein